MLRLLSKCFLALGFLFLISALGRADDRVTRVYVLKNMDMTNVSRVLNIAIRDQAKTRVIGGEGKRLVITDTADQQDVIAQLLPVLDQPMTQTDPDKIQMRMLMNAAAYLRQQKIASRTSSTESSAAPSAAARNQPASPGAPPVAGGVKSYDKFTPAKPYKSIYASDDAKLTEGPRVIFDEPVLPSLSSLKLKGIFRANTGSPLALLSFESTNYTAHDGGLFENNHKRVKDVATKVLKDRVILTGPDRIPREIKFQSTL